MTTAKKVARRKLSLLQPTDERRPGKADADTDGPAKNAHHDALHQELGQHIAAPGADGHANADLPGALGDRDQHDVHDADAAHQQPTLKQ